MIAENENVDELCREGGGMRKTGMTEHGMRHSSEINKGKKEGKQGMTL